MNIYHYKCWTCDSNFSYQKQTDAEARKAIHVAENKGHDAEVWEEVDYTCSKK